MPSSAIITSVLVGGVTTPTQEQFVYRILRASDWTDLGGLRGVLNEPVFKGTLNQGCAALQLDIDHYPYELAYGNMVRVNYPNGQVAGVWRYEQSAYKLNPGAVAYQITLAPFVSELSDADFNANYSTDATQPSPPLGTATFDIPVLAGITRTMHCLVGVIQSNGVPYAYTYNNATPMDALNQAIVFGGSSWWWYCDSIGVVSLRNSSPYNHVVTFGREVTSGEQAEDIIGLYNGYPVIGGFPAGATTSLTAFAVDTNPANQFSVPNIGRRTAQPYSDSSLMDQASVNAVALSLLAYHERVTRQQTLRLSKYAGRRPQPGDAITVRYIDPDPAVPSTAVGGPFLITDVTEYGATRCYDLVISADLTVPLGLMPSLGTDRAMASLMQNPYRSAISPDGSTGTVGSGVISGSGGGAGYTAVPRVPTGLTAATGIDLLAQTNNAYVSLTWGAPPSTDVVTSFEVQWRKLNDSLYYHARTGAAAVKVPGLIQGLVYQFSVRAQNDLGNYSPFSGELVVVAGSDLIAPATPSGLTAVRTPRGALVSWAGNTEKDLQGYVLQVSVAGGGFTPVVSSPSLHTSFAYVAPSGTAIGSTLVFQVAAVDWTGNQSAWSTASANTPTDGVYFDEVMTGNLVATGTITGGMIRTAPSGARVEMDNAGVRLYDGTATDYGSGVGGLTSRLQSTDGTAFFSGTISASSITSIPTPGVPSMDIEMGGTPQILVNDGTGTLRVAIGVLSSGDYGLAAADPTGAAIFDSTGLVQAFKSLGGNSGSGLYTVSTTSGTIFGPTVGITIARRPQNLLILAQCSARANWTAPAISCQPFIGIQIVGFWTSYAHQALAANAVGTGNIAFPFHVYATYFGVPVGTYTVSMSGSVAGSNMSFDAANATIDVYQYGG